MTRILLVHPGNYEETHADQFLRGGRRIQLAGTAEEAAQHVDRAGMDKYALILAYQDRDVPKILSQLEARQSDTPVMTAKDVPDNLDNLAKAVEAHAVRPVLRRFPGQPGSRADLA
jgi:hypothetical protein